MSQKKKLILGPLPEELDLSQYEETVTRWDRVIGVALVGLILLSALIYIFLPEAEQASEQTSEQVSAPAEAQAPVSSGANPPAESSLVMPEEPVVAEEKTTEISEKELPSVAQDPIETSPAEAESSVPTQPVSENTEATSVDSPQKPAADSEALAELSIKHPAISQAVLTLELNNDKPGSPLPAELALPESGITKVILFTEMQGLRGQTLFHDWYRNGVRQARVKIPVNVNTQRSFSSKFINTQMTGDWQVKVVDAKAILYAEAGFSILAP